MHQHPLYRRITVTCECCEIPQDFEFKSATDLVICKGCTRHSGDSKRKQDLRARDHTGLYWSELEISREDRVEDERRHELECDRLRARIAELEDSIHDRDNTIGDLQAVLKTGHLNSGAEQWMADLEVKSAHDKRRSAYRSRDFVYVALWRVAQLHDIDDSRPDYCICGADADSCRELAAISRQLSFLEIWEEKQIERLLEDREHGLPDEHPEVLKYGPGRWATHRHA